MTFDSVDKVINSANTNELDSVMSHGDYKSLLAFIEVAQLGSFTRAAEKMRVSASALSHSVRALETRMQARLLTRTTRSVLLTEEGSRLLARVAPRFADIDAELAAVSDLRNKPSGVVRISASEFPSSYVVWPKLSKILPEFPDITVEVNVNYSRIDIVANNFDAGIRLGDGVGKDMIAVRITADQRIAVVGSPSYFAGRTEPKNPQDLLSHNCINLRLSSEGGLLPWDFQKGKKIVKIRVSGQWIFNSSGPILTAALAGQGLAFLHEEMVQQYLTSGELVRVLDDWCQPYAGYFLYYPNRRRTSGALSVVINALRHNGPGAYSSKRKVMSTL